MRIVPRIASDRKSLTGRSHEVDDLLEVGAEHVLLLALASVVERLEQRPAEAGHQLQRTTTELMSGLTNRSRKKVARVNNRPSGSDPFRRAVSDACERRPARP